MEYAEIIKWDFSRRERTKRKNGAKLLGGESVRILGAILILTGDWNGGQKVWQGGNRLVQKGKVWIAYEGGWRKCADVKWKCQGLK